MKKIRRTLGGLGMTLMTGVTMLFAAAAISITRQERREYKSRTARQRRDLTNHMQSVRRHQHEVHNYLALRKA